jgi:phage shock protein E
VKALSPPVHEPESVMKKSLALSLVLVGLSVGVASELTVTFVSKQPAKEPAANPAIDMQGYLKVSQEAADHRAKRRVSEEVFLEMSRDKGTIVLDARSKEKFDILHIRGAINLSFPDIDVDSLAKTLPDKNARILIYCNNNFDAKASKQGTVQAAFPTKAPTASLNLSTYIALYNYGYRNVYELAPFVDPNKTKLELVPTRK